MQQITEQIMDGKAMSQATFERLTRQLQYEIDNHPHREELVMLATEQLLDDV